MEHAAQNHIGVTPIAPKQKTVGTARAGRLVRRPHAKDKGCSRDHKGQEKISTRDSLANGFLKCSFLPKLQLDGASADSIWEGDFYKSLSLLSCHYHLRLTDTITFGYPYNIAFSLWEAENQLKQSVKSWDCLRLVQDDNKSTFLISEERYRTGTTLYYIPIVPLFRMLKDKRRKKDAHLLLCVCSYLYHIVDVPYYRGEETYMYWQYEMLTDWVEQDEEEEGGTCKSELRQAEIVGDIIEQKLFNLRNMDFFEQRLQFFRSRDEFDHGCWNLAKQAYDLYTQYPAANIFRNASPLGDGYDDEQEAIAMCKYISFIASTEGNLYTTLAECINNEFNEYAQMQEPIIIKEFGKENQASNSLDFENRIFALLDELCHLLDCYKP